jgi:DNA-binding protein YbaB
MAYQIHPDVEAALAEGHRLIDRYLTVVEKYDEVLSVKQSPDGLLQVAVTGGCKVDELFIGDGTLDRYNGRELENAILKLVNEATAEAFAKQSALYQEAAAAH